MRPATVRRLMVFGVCAVGVTALYLAPSVARSPDQVLGRSHGSSEPAEPLARPASFTPRTSDVRPGDTAAQTLEPEPTATAAAAPERRREPPPAPPPSRTSGGATAYDPAHVPDTEPPSAVRSITVTDLGRDRLTVHWAAATDNVGVTGYRVWLNGFQVAETTAEQVTVAWFNDGSGQQVVQVRAVDAAGLSSEQAPTVLVARPTSNVTPTGTPTPTPTPQPSGITTGPQSPASERVPTPSGSVSALDGDG